MKSYIVKWRGPYEEADLKGLGIKHCLYLITGIQKFKRHEEIQYCGMTEDSIHTRIVSHHKKEEVFRNRKYWVGEIHSPESVDRNDLETVEKVIIYYWQPELNEQKKSYSPKKPIALINRWYNAEDELRFNIVHTAQKLRDVIFWDGELWHYGDLKIKSD